VDFANDKEFDLLVIGASGSSAFMSGCSGPGPGIDRQMSPWTQRLGGTLTMLLHVIRLGVGLDRQRRVRS
jgi:hypothetical protein